MNHSVPRTVYEVQEIKDHRSVKEDEVDARLAAEKVQKKMQQKHQKQEFKRQEELHVMRAPFIGNLLALWLGTLHADYRFIPPRKRQEEKANHTAK